MSRALAAYQVFPADEEAESLGMSLAARGAVRTIRNLMWMNSPDQCSFPDDNGMLARMLQTSVDEWVQVREEIFHAARNVFRVKRGLLVCPSLREQAAKQRKYRSLQSKKGKLSAQQRLNRGSTAAQPVGQPDANFPTPTPIPTPTPTPPPPPERLRTSEGRAGSASPTPASAPGVAPSPRKARKPRMAVVDEEFLSGLRTNPAYANIDLDRELGRMDAWLQLPKNRHRAKTREFVLRWLNKIDVPLNGTAPSLRVSGCQWTPTVWTGRGTPPRCGKPIAAQPGAEHPRALCPEHLPNGRGPLRRVPARPVEDLGAGGFGNGSGVAGEERSEMDPQGDMGARVIA